MHKFHGKHTSYKQFILFLPFLYTTSNWCSCIISLKHWRLFTSVSVYCPLPFLQFLHISMLISSSYFPSCFCLCLPLSFFPSVPYGRVALFPPPRPLRIVLLPWSTYLNSATISSHLSLAYWRFVGYAMQTICKVKQQTVNQHGQNKR